MRKRYVGLLLVLAIVLLLRLPSFFEPYWYGDEGIYLAVGQALRRGAVLYRDIWDNKPPLLYLIYALNPTLLWAKTSAAACVLATTAAAYFLTKSIIHNTKYIIQTAPGRLWPLLASLFTGALLSLPLLEGTIANAELYFTPPVVLAACLLYPLINARQSPNSYKFLLIPLLLGALLNIAFFLKVPAVFDFLGLFLALAIIQGNLRKSFKFFFLIIVIAVITFIIAVACFSLHGALPDFLLAAFSQNAAYIAVGSGPFSRFSNPLFLKALIAFIALLALLILFVRKKVSCELLFLSFWFIFSLYGALLSGRPYPHYLLQIVPPGVILTIYLFVNFRCRLFSLVLLSFVFYLLSRAFSGGFALNSYSYYANWFDYISERKSWEDYANYFDSRVASTYAVANYLAAGTSPLEPIFVWGDESLIYVLSDRPPAAKFIQAHHLTTLHPGAYNALINQLIKRRPKYILVTRPVSFPFPALEELIKNQYRPAAQMGNISVYRLSPE